MTDTEMVEGVPTKIVMVGTSSMTLHQRFSRMPKPKVVPSKQTAERPASRGSARGRLRGPTLASRRAAIMRTQPVFEILEPVEDDLVEEYLPLGQQVRRLRAPVFYRRPIEERVTLPPPPQVVYVPVPVRSNRRHNGRGLRGRGVQRGIGQRNNVRGIVNNANFKNRFGGTAGRGGRAGAGRGMRRPHYTPLPKKTVSQLDLFRETYLRVSKFFSFCLTHIEVYSRRVT
ncbi:unnamed protein product [Cylicocyclus nassatus]|uniref:Uncharacterized protein n=1 Tax=Cylicocyclus nassatus TaxID=53992 RepID=A0AA36GPJ7_CYLNA|nr:unnamed protein product [Cylicocyclus nassatus]